MLNKGKKWLGKDIPIKGLAAIAILALVVILIPLLRLTLYAAPWYDDYNYGRFAKVGMEMAGSAWGAFQGALECARTQWYAWQGTYSSIFLMALTPVLWGEEWYFLGPVFIILLLVCSSATLVKVLVRDVCKADRSYCILLQCVVTGTLLVLMYTVQSGIYWYNAGIHYVGMQSFAMLLVSVLILLLLTEHKGKRLALMLLSVLLAFVVAGANFVTALQGLLVTVSIIAVGIWWYRRPGKVLYLLPALCVYILGFGANVTAPGNNVRAGYYVGWGFSPVMSVLKSFQEGAAHVGEFTGWITLLVLLLLVPAVWQMVQKCSFRFRMPGLVLLWSICLYCTGFTPSLYSLGHAGLSRSLNAVKITWQLLLFLNEIYWLGWFAGYWKKKGKKLPSGKVSWLFYPIVLLGMLFVFSQSTNPIGNYSAYGAYYYIHTGEANNFRQQYLERVAELKSDEMNIVFETYRYKPWFLRAKDLSDNPESEENRALATWYGKASVAVKQSE